VKVDAFPYLKHGWMEGRLRNISQESFSAGEIDKPDATAALFGQAGGGAFHRGEVEITMKDLKHLPEGASVIPGMTVSAEIKVGERSVLSFFLNPLTRGIRESMREP
jgi:hemolysin D